ncbi:probable transcriptional regulator slk1 [Phtheirospermum japonicum]|uniref:Probable transcriptional regulator slk1 n=1 Tax=Phtheirospermum japonicum TaxID=374723 RepID=A0A830DJ96_9LAMI|nr:probable transcriptional regulator slk1 [Phtheirospermum japonicum]
MSLEAFLDPNSQYPISLLLPANGGGGSIFESLSSRNSLRNDERMDHSFLSTAQMNPNPDHSVMNSIPTQNTLISRNMEPYTSLPSKPVSFSVNNPVNVCQSGQKERKKKPSEKTCRPVKMKKEIASSLAPSPKRPRADVISQEKVQQENTEKLLLRELQERNLQLTAMIKNYGLQNQVQKPIVHSAPPQLRGFNMQIPRQGNVQTGFAPLLDGSICSRRLKQYLYHLRNNTHDNGIAYWKKFVSEYYAPGSKKRRCGVVTYVVQDQARDWTKFESGMTDEILFLDSPRACNISCGLVLEFSKAMQESVFEKFRVVHEGKLRIVFRYDLKILSWEFCAQNHEEFLLRRFVASQVNQLVQASKTFQNDASSSVSSEDLQSLCDTFVLAGDQLCWNNISFQGNKAHNNQTIENRRRELFAGGAQNLSSFAEQPGPGCLANFRRMPENGAMSGSGSSGLSFVNLHHQLAGQNSSTASVRRNGQDLGFIDHSNHATSLTQSSPLNEAQSFALGEDPHQALVDKLLREMISNHKSGTGNEMRYGESSIAASVQSNSVNASRAAANFCKATSHGNSTAISRSATVKAEPCSPEQLPEALESSALGFAKTEDMSW